MTITSFIAVISETVYRPEKVVMVTGICNNDGSTVMLVLKNSYTLFGKQKCTMHKILKAVKE